MVGMKPREEKELVAATQKKTFCTVTRITTKTNQDKAQINQETVGNQKKWATDSRAPSVELGDLMTKMEQIDKKLKSSDEDYQELKNYFRNKKTENLDNYYVLARATEEKPQQIADKVETTDKEREKIVKKDIEKMKKQYDIVNEKL